MALTEDSLMMRARTSYELGRLRRTPGDSWAVALIVAVGALRHPSGWLIPIVGGALFGLTTLMSWRGQSWGRAVWPGYLAGAVPLLIPSLAPTGAVCWIGGNCWSVCALLCPLSGLIAGLAIALLAMKQEEGRLPFLLGAALIAGITGAFGCALAGMLGILGMIAGGLLGVVPMYLGLRLRRA